ncbi:MAG TPA: AsmA family protein [Acetobacteraceae bacterium]|nr:AsmA family protein [Acetobacteraceae bacterium]
MASARRGGRILLIGLACIVAVFVVAVGVLSTVDLNFLKPRIVAAVKQATGRDLALNGPIGIRLGLPPRVEVRDATFANPPGYSRPFMASVERLDLGVALLPLLSHRYVVDQLILVRPDIKLETNAKGQPNWQFTPSPAGAPPTPAAAPGAGGSPAVIGIRLVRIQDARIAYRDGQTGKETALAVTRLEAKAASADAPLHLTADAAYNGAPFSVVADTGSLARLQDAAATTPWALAVTLTSGQARLAVNGTLTHPMQGRGYALTIDGQVPDTTALTPFTPGIALPPLHDVKFDAKAADKGGPIPEISGLTVHVGSSDLSGTMAGLRLDKLDVIGPALDQPITVNAAAHVRDAPLTVAATLGKPALLIPHSGPSEPYPVNATAQAAGASFTAKGTIANPAAPSGVAIALTGNVPDLAALSALAGRPLPPLKTVTFKASLADAPGGFAKGVALHGLQLTTSAGDVAGEVAAGFGKPPSVNADLKSNRLDADALLAAIGKPAPTPAGQAAAPKAAPPPPAPPPAAPARSGRLFPDQPIPFDLLRLANADLRLKIADLHYGGADYRAIDTRAVLRDGKLAVDPFVADLPQGHLAGKLSADATAPNPAVALTVRAPGLAVRPLLAALGQPAYASGNIEVDTDVRGAGKSPHAIAASLDGYLGLAMAGGTIDNRLLSSAMPQIMGKLNMLEMAKGQTSELRCFAVRLDLQHGVGTFRALALSTSLLTMDGGGTVNLGEETMALKLRPQGRIGGKEVVVPMTASGPIRTPSVAIDSVGAAESNIGALAGALGGGNTPLGALGGLLGGAGSAAPGDVCPAALAVARGGKAPPPAAAHPQAAAPPQPAKRPETPNPAGLLRQLFR